eukprot:3107841-Amphidinium_carterae.1
MCSYSEATGSTLTTIHQTSSSLASCPFRITGTRCWEGLSQQAIRHESLLHIIKDFTTTAFGTAEKLIVPKVLPTWAVVEGMLLETRLVR